MKSSGKRGAVTLQLSKPTSVAAGINSTVAVASGPMPTIAAVGVSVQSGRFVISIISGGDGRIASVPAVDAR
jgi:hypothetical protein